ncbi:hypothetical protein ACE0DR_27735 [Azotobacter sp. CWF10]
MTVTVMESTLVEKIQHLEQFVMELQDELRRARAATLESMLGTLRLRETVLLYVGNQDKTQFCEQLHREFGSQVAFPVDLHLFVLNNAPLPEEQREALRAAFNHGMNKW